MQKQIAYSGCINLFLDDLWKQVPGLIDCVPSPMPYKIADPKQVGNALTFQYANSIKL